MSDIKKIRRKLKKNEKIKIIKKTGIITRKKRMKNMIFVVIFFMCGLIIRIGFIQFNMGSWLQKMAYIQHSMERQFNPKRGTIMMQLVKIF